MPQLMKRGKTRYVRFQYGGWDHWRSKTSKEDAAEAAPTLIANVKGAVSLAGLFDRVLDGITQIGDENERDARRRESARRLLQGTTAKLAVSDAWATWLSNPRKSERGNPKRNTVAGYKAIWARFAGDPENPRKPGWLHRTHKGVRYLHEVTEGMTEDYATELWGSGVSCAHRRATLRHTGLTITP